MKWQGLRIAVLTYYYGSISGEEQQRHALARAFRKHSEVGEVVTVSAPRRPRFIPLDHPGPGNVAIEKTDLSRFDIVFSFNCWDHLPPLPNTQVLTFACNIPEELRSGARDATEYARYVPLGDFHYTNSPFVLELLERDGIRCAFMPLFADETVFAPTDDDGPAPSLVYVGNNLPYKGSAISTYVEPLLHHGIHIYGFPVRWTEHPFIDAYRGEATLAQMRRLYSRSKVCLGITADYQRDYGMVNNRVFEILACGGRLLSDRLPWIERELADFCQFMDPHNVTDRAAAMLTEEPDDHDIRRRASSYVRETHSAAARATSILQRALGGKDHIRADIGNQ